MYFWIFLVLGIVYFLFKDRFVRDGKDAPWVPTDADVVERVMNLAGVSKGDVFYDLGSGDGRFVIAAAMKGATAYGIELSKAKVLYSRVWIRILGLHKRAKIIQKNFFEVNLSDATVINCYLLQETNDKLERKLENELKKGTKIVSVAFEFERFKLKHIDPRGVVYGPIRIYEK